MKTLEEILLPEKMIGNDIEASALLSLEREGITE
jgi:hypothetical protein